MDSTDPFEGTYYRAITTAINAAVDAKFFGDPDSITPDLLRAEQKIIVAIDALRDAQKSIRDRIGL